MKKTFSVFLQILVVLIGIATLAIMIWFPLTEGRAANLDLLSIYADPFIIYGYLASIPFFIALYQAFRLLGNIGQNRVFSLASVKALQNIKYCAIIVSASIVAAGLYIRVFHADGDDPAGFLALCIVTTFISIVVATIAGVFERKLRGTVAVSA